MLSVALLISVVAAAPVEVRSPPTEWVKRLKLSSHYVKSVEATKVPIVASARAHDAALREAAWVVNHMLSERPAIGARINQHGVRLAVMAFDELTTDVPEHSDLTPASYWNRRARGLGATPARPAVSCAEENLLSYPGDPYSTESICVHEFAHVIAQFGFKDDARFQRRLREAYAEALQKGTWAGTYAASNVDEYWAEAVQSFFDTNRVKDDQHGEIATREQLARADPAIHALIVSALGDVPWRYHRVPDRSGTERAELGALPDPLPQFVWPDSVRDVPISHPVPSKRNLELQPVVEPLGATPQVQTPATAFEVTNRSTTTLEVLWVDFQGELKHYATLEPGEGYRQPTYVGHRWVIRGNGKWWGRFEGQPGESKLVLKAPVR